MTRYHVVHRTEYRYGAPISAGHTIAHLTPRDTPGQRTLAHTIAWSPQPDDVEHHTDVFGNTTTYFAIAKAHDRLVVTADSKVEVLAPNTLERAQHKARRVIDDRNLFASLQQDRT